MSTEPKDPVVQLIEAFGKAFAPAITAITEYFRLLGESMVVIKRIAKAHKAGEGLELSADEVKALTIVLTNLSEKK